MAEFFWKDLGCHVFNIEYRLANSKNRWPACGDDCIKAANWLLSEEFSKIAGFSPDKIYICGGSAGGHLALWTSMSLPVEKVAGCISISSVADPLPDLKVHSSRYTFLFGENVSQANLDSMNPVLKIKSGMAPVLCTHASGDKVVPISSHRAFPTHIVRRGMIALSLNIPAISGKVLPDIVCGFPRQVRVVLSRSWNRRLPLS